MIKVIEAKLDKRITFLIFTFFISVILRYGFFLFFLEKQIFWTTDSHQYFETAQSFLNGFGNSWSNGAPNFLRLPLYSIFLAINYFLKINPIITQILLSSLIPILTFLISEKLFKAKSISYIAAVLSSLHVGLIMYSGMLLSETLFTFLFLLFLYFIITTQFASEAQIQNKNLIFAGIALGLLSLTRPVGHFLIIPTLVYLAFTCKKTKPLIQVLIPWLAIVSTILIRNFILTGHIFFHTLPGQHFLELSATPIVMKAEKLDYKNAYKQLEKKLNLENKSEIETCIEKEKLSKKIFLKYPVITIKTWFYEVFKTIFSRYSEFLISKNQQPNQYHNQNEALIGLKADVSPADKSPGILATENKNFIQKLYRYIFAPGSPIKIKLLAFYEILFFILEFLGFLLFLILFFRLNYQQKVNSVFLICLGSILIGLSIASGFARFRLPFEPIIFIFAGYTIYQLRMNRFDMFL